MQRLCVARARLVVKYDEIVVELENVAHDNFDVLVMGRALLGLELDTLNVALAIHVVGSHTLAWGVSVST